MDSGQQSSAPSAQTQGEPQGAQSGPGAGGVSELAASYEREAQARGHTPEAARLWYAAGRLHDEQLNNSHQAGLCYQYAHHCDPAFTPALRAARRVFAKGGDWERVSQFLSAEAQATQDPATQTAIYFEQAVVLIERLQQHQLGLDFLIYCAQQPQGGAAALEYLTLIGAQRGDFANLAEVYERRAGLSAAPSQQAALLCAAAGLQLHRLGQSERGRDLYHAALERSPGHPVATQALVGLYTAAGDLDALIAIYEGLDTEGEVWGALEAARLWLHERGEAERALSVLEAARARCPDDPALLHRLAELYQRLGKEEALGPLTEALAAAAPTKAQAAELWRRAAQRHEADPGGQEAAALAYRRALEASPSDPLALGALGRLYARAQAWSDLLWTYERELEGVDDPQQRSTRLLKMADIYGRHLSDAAGAERCIEQALREAPKSLSARAAALRHFEDTGRWDRVVEVLLADLEGNLPGHRRVELLYRVGRIQEQELDDPDQAAKTYEEILTLDDKHDPSLERLAQLYWRAETWSELVRVLRRQADLSSDQHRMTELLFQAAEVVSERLGDDEGAARLYETIVEVQPGFLPALRALGRSYAEKGAWDKLIEMHRRELEVTRRPEAAVALLLRIGELQEGPLGDSAQAAETYRRAADQSPEPGPILERLTHALAAGEAWEQVGEVLAQRAEQATDPAEKASLLVQLGHHHETRARRPDLATRCYREALSHQPTRGDAQLALSRIYRAAGAWQELAQVLEGRAQSGGPGAPGARAALGQIYLDALDNREAARPVLSTFAGAEDADPFALQLLYRLHLSEGALAAAADTTLQLCKGADPQASLGALAALLLGPEQLRAAAGGGPQVAEQIAAIQPDDPLLLRWAVDRRLSEGAPDPLREQLRAQLEAGPDELTRLDLLLRLGELALREGAPDEAEERFALALTLDARSLPAIQGMKQALLAQDKLEAVEGVLKAEADLTTDPARAQKLRLESAMLSEERSGDPAQAEATYREVLATDPDDPQAHARLARLLDRQGRQEELLQLLEGRAQRVADPTERAAAWAQISDLAERQLRDPQKALSAVEAALEATPTAPALLRRAADIAHHMGHHTLAVTRYGQLVDQAQSNDGLETPLLRLGVLLQDQLKDLGRAAAYLQRLLTVDGRHPEALRRLAAVHAAQGAHAAQAETLSTLAQVTQEPERRTQLFFEVADLYAGPAASTPGAIAALEQVRSADPHNVQAIERLGNLYESQRDWPKVRDLYTTFIQLLPEGDQGRALPLYMRLGELYAGPLSDTPQAVQAYERAAALAPDRPEPFAELVKIFSADPGKREQTIQAHRELLKRAPLHTESYHALFRLFFEQKSFDEAYVLAAILHFLREDNDDERFLYDDTQGRAPDEPRATLSFADQQRLLHHPDARGPLAELLAVCGNQLSKIFPPDMAAYGLGKAQRIPPKDSSSLRKLADSLCVSLEAEPTELYRSETEKHALTVLAADPPIVVVGTEISRRNAVRDQRFFLARLMFRATAGLGLCHSLDPRALGAAIQACVQGVVPDYAPFGAADPELAKRCAKSLSRKARKALEGPAQALAAAPTPDLGRFMRGALQSDDRAGVLLSTDLQTPLRLMAAESGQRQLDAPSKTLRGVERVEKALLFMISPDFFRLRQTLKLSVA